MTTISAQVSNSRKTAAEDNAMCSRSWLLGAGQSAVLFVLSGLVLGFAAGVSSARQQTSTPILVESREVVLPVEVVEERKDPKGILTGPNGEVLHIYIVHSDEIKGLSAKSFHIFDDGVEQGIQHFSVEKDLAWAAIDNAGVHVEYSCTPKGVWSGQDQEKTWIDTSRQLHTYLLTYVPPSSREGTCHQIVLKVDHKHATIFAPHQYCNTKDPLSDPLNGTDFGNRLLDNANSLLPGNLPLSVKTSSFLGSSRTSYRINISAQIPANLLVRKWDGARLQTSIAILGLAYNKNGVLVSRFSDMACVPSKSIEGFNGPLPPNESDIPPPISALRKRWENQTMPTSYQTQLELAPGDYRLEFVLSDGEKFGRATVFVTVDDFAGSGLAISGIALCKRYRQVPVEPRPPTQAPQYIPLVSDGTEFTPAGDARFHKGEPFISFFEIYESQLDDTAATTHLQVKITDVKTGEVKLDSGVEPLKLSIGRKNGSIPVVRTVSIEALSPGSYRLEAQVSDSEGHKTDWSGASFTVE
jgi:hypothetical protein